MEDLIEIKKVLVRKDGIKYVIVPKASKIKGGDLVLIRKVKKEEFKDGRNRS